MDAHFSTCSDGKSITIPRGVNGTSVQIQSSGYDAAGNTVVTFTDGKNVTVMRGIAGASINVSSALTDAVGTNVTFS